MAKTLKQFYGLVKEEKRLSTDSVDDQIDSLLLGYKGSSTVDQEHSLHSLLPLLMEQGPEDEEDPFGDEEGAPPEPEEPLPGEEETPEEVEGSEEIESEEEAQPRVAKIDLDIYAQRVVNLLDNIDNLLDLRTAITNRAMNILRADYGEDVIEEFTRILDQEFGLGLEHDTNQIPERPLGGNAGPSPA